MEAILDHYHAKLAEQNMSEAEVIGERNTNRHLERSSYYYLCVLIMCPQTTIYVSSTKTVCSD
jgi:hypothetical protein